MTSRIPPRPSVRQRVSCFLVYSGDGCDNLPPFPPPKHNILHYRSFNYIFGDGCPPSSTYRTITIINRTLNQNRGTKVAFFCATVLTKQYRRTLLMSKYIRGKPGKKKKKRGAPLRYIEGSDEHRVSTLYDGERRQSGCWLSRKAGLAARASTKAPLQLHPRFSGRIRLDLQ